MKPEQVAKFAKELGIFITPRDWRLFHSLSSSEKGDMISILLGVDVPDATECVRAHADSFLFLMQCNHLEIMKARIADERENQQVLKTQGEAMADDAIDKLALLDDLEAEILAESEETQ